MCFSRFLFSRVWFSRVRFSRFLYSSFRLGRVRFSKVQPAQSLTQREGASGRVSQCAQPISVPILGDNWLICRDQTRGPNWMAEDKSIGGGHSYSLPPSAKLDLNGSRPESLFVRGKHNSSFQEHKSYFSLSSLS